MKITVEVTPNEIIEMVGKLSKSDGPRPTIFICTNLTKGIFVVPKNDTNKAYAGWMPTLEDIVANDWYVY